MNNINNSSSLSNCVSPTSNNQSTAASSRTSPTSLMSPQQQVLNGPAGGLNSAQKLQQQLVGAPTPQSNAVQHQSSDPSSESMSTLKTIAQEVVNRNTVNMVQTPPMVNQQQISQQQREREQLQQQQNSAPYVMDTSSSIDSTATNQNGLNANINNLINATNTSTGNTTGSMKTTGTNEALIPPLLGVAPLGPSPLQKEHQVQVSSYPINIASCNNILICIIFSISQFQMMEAAYYHLPSPSDSERLRPYLQRQPIVTPPHFPQVKQIFILDVAQSLNF